MPHPEPPPNQPDTGNHRRLAPGVLVHNDALRFAAARASGPGGQNVNRRATKVELRVAIDDIPLHHHAARRLRSIARSHLTQHDELLIVSQVGRTQRENKARCLEQLTTLVLRALAPPKQRVATKPTRASNQRRLDAKKQRGEVKKRRANRPDDR